MVKGVRFTQEEVSARLAAMGYQLLGEYQRRDRAVLVRCLKHGDEYPVFCCNLFKGGRMRCCAREAIAAKLRVSMKGAGNGFFGRRHSMETRERISAATKALVGKVWNVNHPDWVHSPNHCRHLAGIPRTKEVRAKISALVKNRYTNFDYCCRLAAGGKTRGKEGIFYVVRVGSQLKFGSATTTMNYRLHRLRAKFPDVTVVLYCIVPDAGAYEAAMMQRHRAHWIRGEYFRDFLL